MYKLSREQCFRVSKRLNQLQSNHGNLKLIVLKYFKLTFFLSLRCEQNYAASNHLTDLRFSFQRFLPYKMSIAPQLNPKLTAGSVCLKFKLIEFVDCFETRLRKGSLTLSRAMISRHSWHHLCVLRARADRTGSHSLLFVPHAVLLQ